MIHIVNCYSCYQKLLNDAGDNVGKLWLDLCWEEAAGLVCLVENNGVKYELAWLEEMGFIVTRESNEFVQVKMLGRSLHESQGEEEDDIHIAFCVCGRMKVEVVEDWGE